MLCNAGILPAPMFYHMIEAFNKGLISITHRKENVIRGLEGAKKRGP